MTLEIFVLNHFKKYSNFECEGFCNFLYQYLDYSYLFFSVQYYISSLVFDLWSSVSCIQPSLLHFCISLYHVFAWIFFFFSFAEITYSY